ncbi:MAG: M48 family metallopeptidase [Elusimicrobiota bacterium]|jgi:heat shock protein HtpX|nr:M48 family metallopeptidase [Elusimicrobiota bacterium]
MSKITTYDFIASNKRKTVFLMILFPLSLIVLVYAALFFVSYISADPSSGQGYYQDPINTANILAMEILPVISVIAIIFVLIGYFSGQNFILAVSGGVELTRENAPEIIRIVENLSITAGIPMPRVFAMDDESLNAFATGRDPKHSYIALTKGLVNTLEKDELEGVIAHEMSHIKNYDIRIMLITIACISFATIIAEILLRFAMFSGRGRDSKGNGIRIVLIALAVVFFVYGYLLAPLIRLAVSRAREFQADATAALITRNPQGLINALRKISGHSEVKKLNDKETISSICIASPLRADKHGTAFSRISGLFSTHPPIEDRIKALQIMDGQR